MTRHDAFDEHTPDDSTPERRQADCSDEHNFHIGNTTSVLRGPADLVRAVPWLLGFHPQRSLVLVGLTGSRLQVTARLDLPATGAAPTASSNRSGTAVADGVAFLPGLTQTLDALATAGVDRVVAIHYPGARPSLGRIDQSGARRELFAALDAASCARGLILLDCLTVVDGRWWSACCVDAVCCPHDGTLIPEAPGVFETDLAYAGRTVAASRDDLAARLRPRPGAERDALFPLLHAAERRLHASAVSGRCDEAPLCADHAEALDCDNTPIDNIEAVRADLLATVRTPFAVYPGGGDVLTAADLIDDQQAADIGAVLRLRGLRDAVWIEVDRDGQTAAAGEYWLDLARRLPSPYDAAPLFFYAWHAWRRGDGVTASLGVDRALSSEPGYRAGRLLRHALDAGIDPRRFPALSEPADDQPTGTAHDDLIDPGEHIPRQQPGRLRDGGDA